MRRPIVGGILVGLCALMAVAVGGGAPRAAEAQRPVLMITSNRDNDGPKIFMVDPDNAATNVLHNPKGSESLAAWSPDGKKISFCSSRAGNHDIWLMDADGENVTQLTTDKAPDYISAWSPDGKKILFTTERAGNPEIFIMNADGSDQNNLTADPEFDGDPAWSPDGKKILFVSKRDGSGHRLFTMDPDGTNVKLFPGKPGGGGPVFPAWSPDGKRIVYSEEVDGSTEIFTCDADGGNIKKLTSIGGINTYAAWSPDGKRIALEHWDNRQSDGVIWVMNLADGVQSLMGAGGSYLSGRPAWKPAAR